MNATWIEGEHLTEKDMGLLIDKDEKIMYVWEGKYVSPQTSMKAKEILSRKKAEYPFYKVRSAKKEKNEELNQILVNIVSKSYEKDKKTQKKDSKNLIFQKGLTSFILILSIIVFFRLFFKIDLRNLNFSLELQTYFLSELEYSRFIQYNLILNIISLICLISLIYLYVLNKSIINIVVIAIVIFLLSYNIFWTWYLQSSIILFGIDCLLLIPTLFLPSKKQKTNI